MGDVCTDLSEPMLPLQEIHSCKCTTGLCQVHKNRKNIMEYNAILLPLAKRHFLYATQQFQTQTL